MAMTDTPSEQEKRYWRVHLADAWAPRQNQTRHSLSTPVNVSCWVELHGETQARVPRSIEILIQRSRGLFETGMHKKLSGRRMDFFPNHFSAVVSTSKY